MEDTRKFMLKGTAADLTAFADKCAEFVICKLLGYASVREYERNDGALEVLSCANVGRCMEVKFREGGDIYEFYCQQESRQSPVASRQTAAGGAEGGAPVREKQSYRDNLARLNEVAPSGELIGIENPGK